MCRTFTRRLYPGILIPRTRTGRAPTWQLVYEPLYNNGTNSLSPSRHLLRDGTTLPRDGLPVRVSRRYSQAQLLATGSQCGWIHSPAPYAFVPRRPAAAPRTQFDAIAARLSPEHEPQPARPGRQPANPDQSGTVTLAGGPSRRPLQTDLVGLPHLRETLSPTGPIPTVQVNVGRSRAHRRHCGVQSGAARRARLR